MHILVNLDGDLHGDFDVLNDWDFDGSDHLEGDFDGLDSLEGLGDWDMGDDWDLDGNLYWEGFGDEVNFGCDLRVENATSDNTAAYDGSSDRSNGSESSSSESSTTESNTSESNTTMSKITMSKGDTMSKGCLLGGCLQGMPPRDATMVPPSKGGTMSEAVSAKITVADSHKTSEKNDSDLE